MMISNNQYKIVPCYAHFEVYYHGQFMSSADTLTEAENDIEEQNYKINEQKGKVRTA